MSDGRRAEKIRVLIVDDSAVARNVLTHVLESDPRLQVVGTASNGDEAVDAVNQKKPDVVTMDYHMPRMNGLNATRKIMESHPLPIVIVSATTSRDEVAVAHSLLEAGALAVVEKPAGPGHPRHEAMVRELVQTVRLMAEVKVVKRWPRRGGGVASAPARAAAELKPLPDDVRLVAIGASTGGPLVLQAILSALPRNFPAPIAIVQHISTGFTHGLVAWLAQSSGVPVHVAKHGERLLPGHAYIAPDELHMTVTRDGHVSLGRDAPEHGHRPAVSPLFRSVAQTLGRNAIGILLTGMGKDGAEELKLLRDKGALTIAQDRQSSVVHGMPGEAIHLDAASHVLSPPEISAALAKLAK